MDPKTQAAVPEAPARARPSLLGRVPLQWRVLGAFLALQTAVLSASLIWAGRVQGRHLSEQLARELGVTRSVFDAKLQDRRRQLTLGMRLLARDYALRQALGTRDVATIMSAAENFRDRIGAGGLWLTDARGRVYLNNEDEFPVGGQAAAQAALGGEATLFVSYLRGVPCQVIAMPILAPDVVGVLIGEFPIDDQAAVELKQATNSEVSFDVNGEVTVSTLDNATRAELESSLRTLAFDRPIVVGPPGRRQVVLSEQIAPGIAARIQRSWEAARRPLRELQVLLLLIGGVGFVLTALLGYYVAEAVTASIRSLVRQLSASNEELSRVNSFQSKFFSMVAHDVRNPLNSISAYVQIIQQENHDPALGKFIDKMPGMVSMLNFLISDLVDFAAIENGLLRMKPREMSLVDVVLGLKDRMGPLAERKNVQFEIKAVPDLPRIIGDPDRIAQVLQNLSSNALQYTPAGGTVTVIAARQDDVVRLLVKDTGIGIAANDLPRIFERFFQARNAQEMRAAGFGLGLKIAREIVEAHGGHIEVESVLGRGSTFTVVMPLRRADLPPPPAAAPEPEPEPPSAR
jgi:signal transduction histidine kinase